MATNPETNRNFVFNALDILFTMCFAFLGLRRIDAVRNQRLVESVNRNCFQAFTLLLNKLECTKTRESCTNKIQFLINVYSTESFMICEVECVKFSFAVFYELYKRKLLLSASAQQWEAFPFYQTCFLPHQQIHWLKQYCLNWRKLFPINVNTMSPSLSVYALVGIKKCIIIAYTIWELLINKILCEYISNFVKFFL